VKAGSARIDISGAVASINMEYVYKSEDPHDANNYDPTTGKSFLTNVSFSKGNLGASFNFRTLENMDFRSEREATQSTGLMNYIPALTRQHDYFTMRSLPEK
jgi:predicted mannosyl-3-phosphoglycerate phosphatase (HAD superfamily)